MTQRSRKPPAAGHELAAIGGPDVARLKIGRTASANSASKVLPVRRETTIEDRLEAKAARGNVRAYTGASLDKMTREQRHRLLYGE